MPSTTTTKVAAVDNVSISVHAVDQLRAAIPDWDSLSKRERLAASRRVEPTSEFETSNVTTVSLHEYLVQNLLEGDAADANISHLAIGDDDSSEPSAGNTTLNNEQDRFQLTESYQSGSELFTSTFLDSTEANGVDIVEVGLYTASTNGILCNHALIEEVTKTPDNTATIDVSLSFSNP